VAIDADVVAEDEPFVAPFGGSTLMVLAASFFFLLRDDRRGGGFLAESAVSTAHRSSAMSAISPLISIP
jgi:hypothetical protein